MLRYVAVKWLIITVIAVVGLLVVLLFLGYLLKENEVTTTKLKAQLDQEAIQRKEKESRNNVSPLPQITLSAFEKSQQQIIVNNLECQSDKQCFLVHTDSQVLGCIVAVNTMGAVILLKVASENKNKLSSSNLCQQSYEKVDEISAQCKKNRCSFSY